MPFQSDGSFIPLIVFINSGSTVSLQTGQQTSGPPALAEAMNSEFADITTGLGQCLNRLGYGAMQANLPMGGNKIVSVANGVATTDGATIGQLPGGGAAPLILSGSSNPSASATYVGQMYVQTTTKKVYMATSTGSGASDWTILN